MSVEIDDVGLETAAEVKLRREEKEPPKQVPTVTPLTNPKVRRGLVLAAIVVFAVAAGLYWYFYNR